MEKFKIIVIGKRPDGAEAYGVEINNRYVEIGAYITDGKVFVATAPLFATMMPENLHDYADAIKLLANHMAAKLKPLIVAQ